MSESLDWSPEGWTEVRKVSKLKDPKVPFNSGESEGSEYDLERYTSLGLLRSPEEDRTVDSHSFPSVSD